ncbi:unnamed protein product [Hymenolepis diminuta]|uniref:Uncharacterized protein n=1 Tax=Hymenolepis diminuta TaxID=6216 RepID=A0A564XU39_HYMDI|nr:unnamed protein product [Hymenolepis diminuta]
MEESEFVVVDDEHGTFNGLKEAVQAYGNAKDALCKGITLLNNTLNLTMELALKNAPPDFDSNSEELRNRVLGSLEISPEAVLRDHVKSLCSKLVAMQAQYGELVKQYEDLRMEKSVEQPPQVIRLAGILDEIEACLPNSGFESSTTASTAIKDLDGLCTRAESIRDRIKVAITKPVSTDASVSNSASCYSKDFGENSGEPSTPKVDSEMNVNRMIREEVVSVLKSEMGSMMERQMDYIQQVLKPLKMDSQEPTASSQQDCGSGEYCDAEDSSSPTSPSVSGNDGPLKKQKPSYLPDDERPLCPKCQMWLPDRQALEFHLDTCLL